MWPNNVNADSYLYRKLSGAHPFTAEDRTKAAPHTQGAKCYAVRIRMNAACRGLFFDLIVNRFSAHKQELNSAEPALAGWDPIGAKKEVHNDSESHVH